MKLPMIHEDTLRTLLNEALTDKTWTNRIIDELVVENPHIFRYLCLCKDVSGEKTALTALILYKALKNQCEIDEMEL